MNFDNHNTDQEFFDVLDRDIERIRGLSNNDQYVAWAQAACWLFHFLPWRSGSECYCASQCEHWDGGTHDEESIKYYLRLFDIPNHVSLGNYSFESVEKKKMGFSMEELLEFKRRQMLAHYPDTKLV